MTRELLLEEHDGVYCEKVQREQKGQLVDYYRKTLCAAFVKLLVSGDPSRVKVVLSDKEEAGWVPVKVTRVGHYRWWWEFPEAYNTPSNKAYFYNTTYGMYRACEDILMNIFPLDFDEKDKDGKWKAVIFLSGDKAPENEHSLWIKIIAPYEEVHD